MWEKEKEKEKETAKDLELAASGNNDDEGGVVGMMRRVEVFFRGQRHSLGRLRLTSSEIIPHSFCVGPGNHGESHDLRWMRSYFTVCIYKALP